MHLKAIIVKAVVSSGCAFLALWAASPVLARPVAASDLLTLNDVAGIGIAPNGRYIAYQVHRSNVGCNCYSNHWLVADGAGRTRLAVADAGQPIWDDSGEWYVSPAIWSPDSTRFYFVARYAGKTALYSSTVDGRRHRVSPASAGDVYADRTLSPNEVEFTAHRVTAAAVNHANDELLNGRYFSPAAAPWEGRINIFAPWEGKPDFSALADTFGYVLNLSSGSIVQEKTAPELIYSARTTGKDIPDFYFGYQYTPDPARTREAFVAYTKRLARPGSLISIFVAPLSGRGKTTQLLPLSPEPVRQIQWSADGQQIFYLKTQDYVNADLYSVDVKTKAIRRITHSDAQLQNCSFAVQAHRAACSVETATKPAEVAFIDLRSGEVQIVSNLNPAYNALDHSPVQTLAWTNKHGDVTFGQLVRPLHYQRGKRYPLIITMYRASGFQRGAVGDEYPIQAFAADGNFVLNFDIYNTGYAPIAANNQQPFDVTILEWQSPLDSLAQIINTLDRQGLIDSQRIGIGGLSHASEITLYAISHADIFRAAISDGGSARDPLFYYLKSSNWVTIFKAWGLDGPPYEKNLPKWTMLSPAMNADRIRAPLLMNAPDSEWVIALQQYWEMHDHGRPVEMYIFHNEAHIKKEPLHRLVVYRRNIDWYNYWLHNRVDGAASKRQQYKRWAVMREQLRKRGLSY